MKFIELSSSEREVSGTRLLSLGLGTPLVFNVKHISSFARIDENRTYLYLLSGAEFEVQESVEEILALINKTSGQLSAAEADKEHGLFGGDEQPTAFARQWLDVRTCNVLRNQRISTFSQLCELSGRDLRRCKNIGRKSTARITAMLHDLGLSLKYEAY